MRWVSVVATLVGFTLTACGDPEPAGGALPPSPTAESSAAPAPTTSEDVPGTGEPYDPAARLRPDLMTVTPDEAAPGEQVELTFPEQTERGVAYVLERAVGESWSTTHFLTSSTDGYGGGPSAVSVDSTQGYGWEDIGIGGPGPDRLVLPNDATAGPSRICTANARENFCAEITVIESSTAPSSPGTTPDTTAPDTTTPGTTAPDTTTPDTTTPDTTAPGTTAPGTTAPGTTAPGSTAAPVPIIAVHESVTFYPACGNEILTFDGLTWYPLNHYDGYDEEYAAIYQAFADAERDPSPVASRHGFAPAVAEPGPGDDVGTLVIWADGVARWVSESGDLDVWMVDDELTYDWEC